MQLNKFDHYKNDFCNADILIINKQACKKWT